MIFFWILSDSALGHGALGRCCACGCEIQMHRQLIFIPVCLSFTRHRKQWTLRHVRRRSMLNMRASLPSHVRVHFHTTCKQLSLFLLGHSEFIYFCILNKSTHGKRHTNARATLKMRVLTKKAAAGDAQSQWKYREICSQSILNTLNTKDWIHTNLADDVVHCCCSLRESINVSIYR